MSRFSLHRITSHGPTTTVLLAKIPRGGVTTAKMGLDITAFHSVHTLGLGQTLYDSAN
jgi:hypothetical protein